MSQNISSHFSKDKIHHAYLIEGDYLNVYPEIEKFLEKINFSTTNNPDYINIALDSFKIEDARKLKELNNEKSFSENKKIFIISANRFLEEAQNTLLKLFEEPNSNTHLFLITPDVNVFLKTLLSRLYVIRKTQERKSNQSNEVSNFLKMSLNERLNFIKNSFSAKENEENDVSIRTEASRFIDSLEQELEQKIFHGQSIIPSTADCFTQIFKARTYLRQNGTSPKGLLEGVAVAIPKF